MVLSLADLTNLPAPQSVVEYEYEVIRDDCVDVMAANVPGWSASPDSGLYKGWRGAGLSVFSPPSSG